MKHEPNMTLPSPLSALSIKPWWNRSRRARGAITLLSLFSVVGCAAPTRQECSDLYPPLPPQVVRPSVPKELMEPPKNAWLLREIAPEQLQEIYLRHGHLLNPALTTRGQ